MAKRKSKATGSAVVDVADAMGEAVGKALAALGSMVGRKRGPNGYERLAQERQRAASADRSRAKAAPTAGVRKRRRTTKAR